MGILLLLIGLASITDCARAHQTSVRLYNACPFPVWPAWIPNAGLPQLGTGGAQLNPWQSLDVVAPWGWAGRFWGRTGCSFDSSGKAKCETGDCDGAFCCATGGIPPATLAEFTPLHEATTHLDFYDVSLVDGYNLPMAISPDNPSCKSAGCHSDLNARCPPELAIRNGRGHVIACKSACLAYKQDKYCCTGPYNSPRKCKATSYSQCFKNSCPNAYSYAFDAVNSGFSCPSATQYTITFCPSSSKVGDGSIQYL